jgi:hypothetical protein
MQPTTTSPRSSSSASHTSDGPKPSPRSWFPSRAPASTSAN